jgi:hypothetical protein
MMTQNEAKRFHDAARVIELDGAEGYFSCCDRFGPEVAGMALVMWTRCHFSSENDYPSLEVHERLMKKTNKILEEAGRLVNEGSSH